MDLTPGTLIADRYVVEALIGSGGTAMVYRVRDRLNSKALALKVVRIPDPVLWARLEQEGRLQRELEHPHVVHVKGTVEIDGYPGLIMELVPGPTLADLLRRRRLTLQQVDWIAEGLLRGVAAAHQAGITHRDLKPANVLLAQNNGVISPMITDFGIAKVIAAGQAAGHTRSGMTLGTPSYMAPEQVRDPASVDARADLWSVGTLLYEMITGVRAFGGDDPFEIYRHIEEGRFVSPREYYPELPARMERAIVGALAPDRLHRVSSAAELHALWRGGAPVPPARVCRGLLDDAPTQDDVPTAALPEEDPAAPVQLALPPPAVTEVYEGESTMIARIHREYGIAAAVAVMVLTAALVMAVGGGALVLGSMMWRASQQSGPTLVEGVE